MNSENSLAWVAWSMPIPVSVTVRTTRQSSPAGSVRRLTRTSPSWVNFTALETRFERHWRTRTGSKHSALVSGSVISSFSSMPFSRARGSNRRMMRRAAWRRSPSMGSISSLPASILVRSSTSSTRASSVLPESRMVSTFSRWLQDRVSSDTSDWAMPRMPFSGVRISWLIEARNWDLAILAASVSLTLSSVSLNSVMSKLMPTMAVLPSAMRTGTFLVSAVTSGPIRSVLSEISPARIFSSSARKTSYCSGEKISLSSRPMKSSQPT